MNNSSTTVLSSDSKMFKPIPWTAFEGDNKHYWVHYGMVIAGFVLVYITYVAQRLKPAPYGKHASQDANWGPMIPQRLGHIASDAIPGIVLVLMVFFLYGEERGWINIVFLCLFVAHYIQRGLIHTSVMRYSNQMVPLGITVGGLFPNCLFHFLNADWIGSASYDDNYYYDPRFIIGIMLFAVGFVINRWADWKLRSLRQGRGKRVGYSGYYIPYGGLFELVSCPNYFGELMEWFGWATVTWSLAGLAWCLFGAATFFPRSRHNHRWYHEQFTSYPKKRKALIPYLY